MNELHTLKLKNLGIDSYLENMVFMRADCHIFLSEGFKAETRVLVGLGKKSIVATLNIIHSDLLHHYEGALSEIAMERLEAREGDEIRIEHLEPLESLRHVRSKIFGHKLPEEAYHTVIHDIVAGKYSDVQLAAFVTACSGKKKMQVEEIISLTRAMVAAGDRLNWPYQRVMDKHCVGGLPGNRTTPIIVSVVAAAGFYIPKTSSRAITSPAGTADVMEVITNVNLTEEKIKEVVSAQKGCLAWGGNVRLSPADDILIRIERALDIDSEAQMVASVLSKKAAMGCSHVLLDIPVGLTAKVRSWEDAEALKKMFSDVAHEMGLTVEVMLTEGSQPIGRGIGPSLEARDVLSVLRNERNAPSDLREKAIKLSGRILEMTGHFTADEGIKKATDLLNSGEAYKKFEAICKAQGRFTEPQLGAWQKTILSKKDGVITGINNRGLAMLAKLSGAPLDKTAGVLLLVRLGDKTKAGEALFEIYSGSEGTLNYALSYFNEHDDIIEIE